MSMQFDPGYASEPFRTLCQNYPGADVYPAGDFRIEWGPIFHRGRLDGSARILVIGQDPATSETFARRILVGAAGQRTQGLLAKLGITRSYVLVNTFLYSVASQAGGERHKSDAAIRAYRNQWLSALFGNHIEAVIALGALADQAWKDFVPMAGPHAHNVAYAHVKHPTWPESSSRNDRNKLATATTALLADWNAALELMAPKIVHPDVTTPLQKYGSRWQPGDLVGIPSDDLPPGLPEWVRSPHAWASREGATAAEKRATLVIRVPKEAMPVARTQPLAARETEDTDAVAALATAVHLDGTRKPVRASNRYALRGRVVTMTSSNASAVLKDGVVWIKDGTIVAVQKPTDAPPAGLDDVEPIPTDGTIYPGFMDLHNHLAYNIASLWQVPASYGNRDQWKADPTYDQLVRRPLGILGKRKDMLPAICRYVECKSLFGGATTTQGIRLAQGGAITSYFRGMVRNVEMPDDAALPRAESHMPDVAAKEVESFWKTIGSYEKRQAEYLLHLSEGIDAAARSHFDALRRADGSWAIQRALAGIHCAALKPEQLQILKDNGGSMIWSPFSNLLLYGATANVAAAKDLGLRIALGCDWSPSGSKNLLGEMKVAWLYSEANGSLFSPFDIVSMVTSVSADILRWGAGLGTIEAGKIADLTVLASTQSDPYQNAIQATEADVSLVVIGGVPRYGHGDLVRAATSDEAHLEEVLVAGQHRTIDLESTDARVPTIRFTEAKAVLTEALRTLPALEVAKPARIARYLALRPAAAAAPGLALELDETEDTGMALHLETKHPAARALTSKKKLPTIPVDLDPATVADHAGYFDLIAAQKNLPQFLKKGLGPLYGEKVAAPRVKPAKPKTRVAVKAAKASGKTKGKKNRGRRR